MLSSLWKTFFEYHDGNNIKYTEKDWQPLKNTLDKALDQEDKDFDDLMGVILKDIKYEDDPKSRELVRKRVYF